MKTFKEYLRESFLLEAKIDDYKAQETNIPTDHDPDALHKEPTDIIDHFHAHNPTGNVIHTQKYVEWYKKGLIKQEDAPAMKETLTNFNKFKDKLPKKRLEQYKTPAELQLALHPHIGTSTSEKQSAQTEKDMNENTTTVYSSPNVTLRHIHNTLGSIAASAHPDNKRPPWCTAREDSGNMFDYYNQKTGGKFYTLHTSLPFPDNKFGIAVGAEEFQDATNTKKEGNKLKGVVKQLPEIREIPELQGVSIHTTKLENVEKHIHDLLDNDTEDTKHEILYRSPTQYSKKVRDTIDQHSDEMQKAEDEDTSVKNSKFKSVLKTLAGSTGDAATLEHLSKHEDDGVKVAVAKNYSTPKQIRYDFLKHPNPMIRSAVELRDFPEKIRTDIVGKETNPSVLAKHVMGDDSIDVQQAALSNQHINAEALGSIGQVSQHKEIRKAVLEHPKADSDTLMKLSKNHLSSEDEFHAIVKHPKVNDETLGNIARSHSDNIKMQKVIVNHPKAGASTLDQISRDTEDSELQKAIVKHPATSADTLANVAYRTEDPELQKAIIKHPKVEANSLFHITQRTEDPEIQKAIVKHPKVENSALRDIARNTSDSEIHKAIVSNPTSNISTIHHVIDNTEDHDVLHHILNNHNGRLQHADLNGIKRKLGSKVPEVYPGNVTASQDAIDNVRNEGKPVVPPKKAKAKSNAKPFDLFKQDWFKED